MKYLRIMIIALGSFCGLCLPTDGQTAAHTCDPCEQTITSLREHRATIFSGNLYMEGKRARLIKVKVGNPSDLKVLSVPYALPPGTISYFNFEGSFLYAVLAPNLNSGMQSFDLRRFPLDEIILGKRKTTLVNDSAPVEEKRRAILNEIFKDLTLPEGVVVGLEPLSNVFRWSKLPIIMPLDLPWKPGPIWYDVLINQGNSYTLYILNNNNLAIWNTVLKGDGGHDRPEWKEIASLKTEFNEPFAVFAQGNNASIVTASGEVFVISGEKLTKVSAFTPQVSGEGSEKRENYIVENKDTGEVLLISAEKSRSALVPMQVNLLKGASVQAANTSNEIMRALNAAVNFAETDKK